MAARNCVKDEGGPLGAGLQEQAPNHLKVSVEEKSRQRIVAGVDQGDEYKRTTDEVSKQ
jgi:hypothetical protein